MAVAHVEAHAESQRLCDAVFNSLQSDLPSCVRKETTNVCSIGCGEGPKLIFIYHRKKQSTIRIYFVGDHQKEPSNFPSQVRLFCRAAIKSTWDRKFPYYFEVSTDSFIQQIAEFLITILKEGHAVSAGREDLSAPEEVPEIWEGEKIQITVNAYERSQEGRNKCLAHWGTKCVVL